MVDMNKRLGAFLSSDAASGFAAGLVYTAYARYSNSQEAARAESPGVDTTRKDRVTVATIKAAYWHNAIIKSFVR